MAVDIPVVVDIEKAFDDAAARVDTAIKPLKKKIEKETAELQLNVTFGTGEYNPQKLQDILKTVKKDIGGVNYATYELNSALQDAKARLDELYVSSSKSGGTMSISQRQYAASLRDAIILLESELDLRKTASSLATEAAQRQIAVTKAINAGNSALVNEARTMSELNDKISALRGKLENIDPARNKKEWESTATEIKTATAELSKYESKYKELISVSAPKAKVGSIDRIKAEMQELINKWNAMSQKVKFDADGKLSAKAQKLIQQYKDLTAQSERYGRSLQQMASVAIPSIEKTSAKLRSQSGILRALTGYLSIYTAIFGSIRFIRNIRETTAEFELQRVALGGIIQDADRANALFKEIKAAAVESPFQIRELVRYTKQLSAYRVETEDLFKTTMKLADVSAGLGVDMNRIILAYGQVKAAAVLRGQELRQFTEAGIPLVEELAKKFRELGREGTTTADVFELISKRAVPFEMIAEIFDDMTERGGVFYKMQEKQAETLKGQWNNLKDALSIMYDEMGNTDTLHSAMSTLLTDAKVIFQNWRLIANSVKIAAIQFGVMKAASLWLPNLKRELTLAKKAQDALTRSQELGAYAADSGSKSALRASARLEVYSKLMRKASIETNFFKRSWLQMKAVMTGGGWIGLAVAAFTTLASVIGAAVIESRRLNKELNKIGAEGQTSINRSVSNFKRLADEAVNATDGSKEQVRAIEELKRTYGDIIPIQNLEVNKLRELQGSYESLTVAIREKINEQLREQKISAVVDEYTKKITKKQKRTKDFLSAYGLDKEQISAVMESIQEAVENGVIGINSTLEERHSLFKSVIRSLTGLVVDFGNGFRDLSGKWNDVRDNNKAEKSLNDLLDVYLKMNGVIGDINDSMKESIGSFGKFSKMSKDLDESLASIMVDTEKYGKKGTFANNQEKIKQTVEIYWDYLKRAFDEVNRERSEKIDISKAFLGDGKIDFSFINEAVKDAMTGGKNTKLDAFIREIQEGYEKLVPSDRIVNLVREKVTQLANQFSVPMDQAQTYFKKAETSMEDWVKSLQDAEKQHTSTLNQMKLNNEEIEKGTMVLKAYSAEEISAEENVLSFVKALLALFSAFKKNTGRQAGYTQDPFIKQMEERIKYMKDFKKGYDDLNKFISSSDALSKVGEQMKTRGLALGLDVTEQTRAAEDLSKWYEDMMDKVFDQAKKHGATGTIESFLSQQIKDATNKGKALKDFQKLLQSLFDAKTDLDVSNLKKSLEDNLKRVQDEIKRSETARNFYKDILDLSGDEELATNMAVSVYGGIGNDFKTNMQKQLNAALNTLDGSQMTEKLVNAFKSMDFDTILKDIEKFPDEQQKVLRQLASDYEKYNADIAKDLLKSLQNAKTYGEKRVELAQQTAKRIAQINAMNIPESEKEALRSSNAKKEAEEAQKIAYESFKESPMYVELFANLDRASTKMLRNMRGNLEAMKSSWKDLPATDLKEMQSRLEELDSQLATKNPFRELIDSMKEYREMRKNMSRSEADATAVGLTEYARLQKEALDIASKEYEIARDTYGLGSLEEQQAKDNLEVQKAVTDEAIEQAEAAQDVANGYRKAKKHIEDAANGLKEWAGYITKSLDGVQKIVDTFASDDVADTFGIISEGIGETLEGAGKIAAGAAMGVAGIPEIISGIGDVVAGTFGMAQKLKIKDLNKKIEEQERIVESLDKSYDHLEKAMAKAFGSDYIANYNKQLEELEAKQKAYEEQARLEGDKGKKADEDKIREYSNAAKDAQDEIDEMKGKLAEFFSGTDVTSAAKDFANAWIEAYREFGSTTDAMKEKFQELIQNMVEQSLGAKIMQSILDPLFQSIDDMAASGGELSAQEIAQIAQMAPEYIDKINDAMTNLMTQLAAAGYNVRQQVGGFTGISRDIAGASEESINGLAAGINTQNFYMSLISQNVASILAALTGSPVEGATGAGTPDVTDPYKDQMLLYAGSLPQMRDDMYAIRSMLEKVVRPNGTNATHYVAVRM